MPSCCRFTNAYESSLHELTRFFVCRLEIYLARTWYIEKWVPCHIDFLLFQYYCDLLVLVIFFLTLFVLDHFSLLWILLLFHGLKSVVGLLWKLVSIWNCFCRLIFPCILLFSIFCLFYDYSLVFHMIIGFCPALSFGALVVDLLDEKFPRNDIISVVSSWYFLLWSVHLYDLNSLRACLFALEN